jgi:ABC-type dipeptide/oligopeptide/nickel transport system permease subunit
MRASDADLENGLSRNGYRDNFFRRYGRWIGLVQKQPVTDPNTGETAPRFRYCDEPSVSTYSGIRQGDFGCSTAFRIKIADRLPQALSAAGIMMFWVMIVMVPCSLVIGVLAGMAYLLGGDKLARDVFSRIVHGSRIVLAIAPAAVANSLMVGSLLGLPAGHFGGRINAILSFVAKFVLAVPVILLFYLLVTPGIMDTPVPYAMASFLFIFPVLFFVVLFYTGYSNQARKLAVLLALTVVIGGRTYAGLVFDAGLPDIVSIEPNELNIFVAVAFVSGPGVFRIVRGLTLDIKTREYIDAALTRGETPWYIMLWEILPTPGAIDRRYMPAHRLHHDPSRHARLLRSRHGFRESRPGHGDQG